jgi:hypothetical protein
VVIKEFQAAYGAERADLAEAMATLLPTIERRLRGRKRQLERLFATSLFVDPMLATANQWTNGQHRCQAAIDAGCRQVLFCR